MTSLGRLARTGILASSLLLTSFAGGGAPVAGQTSPCDLVAPFELSELLGAAFGPGEPTDTGCTWGTETPGGFLLVVTLDVSTDPPTVTVDTQDPGIDPAASAAAIAALVAERQEQGTVAPTPFAGGGAGGDGTRPDLCELFTPEDVGALLSVASMSEYGNATSCGWSSTESGRVMPAAVVAFEPGDISGGIQGFPDTEDTTIAGFPGLVYGWEATGARSVFITLDLGDGVLTTNATADLPEVDAEAVARTLAERVLAAMGHEMTAGPSPAP